MTTQHDLDRRIEAFLSEGPVDLSSRVRGEIRIGIDTVGQRQPVRIRRPSAWTRAALAMAACLVVAAIAAVVVSLQGRADVGPPPASPPIASGVASDAPGPSAGLLPAAGIADGDAWIVYVSGPVPEEPDALMLIRPDGSDARRIGADAGREQRGPDWSHAGDRIAFEAGDGTGDGDGDGIWIWSAADGTSTRVVRCADPCVDLDDPAWSPGDGAIAFVTRREADDGSIVSSIDVLDIERGAVDRVVDAAAGTRLRDPRWSPDRQTLVVAMVDEPARPTDPVSSSALGIVPADGSGRLQRLTDPAMLASAPDWHPTEDLIAFSTRNIDDFSTTPDPANLYLIRSDGSGLQAITTYGAGQRRPSQPTWTPDGARIIFTAAELTHHVEERHLAVIDRDGTDLEWATGRQAITGTEPRMRPTP